MDFFNKAKQAAEKYGGGSSSSSSNTVHEKKKDDIFSKAMDAAEKYHVKEKAVEYAQKRVDERKLHTTQHPGEKKDESTFDKARVAAEDFLAKQGQPKPHSEEKKDNQMGDFLNKAKDAYGKYSKKH